MGSRVPFSALMTGFLTHFTHHRLSKYETENYERLSPENALSSISAGRRKELCCRHSRWSGEPRTHLGRQKTNLSGKVRLASRVCATTLSFLFAMLLPGLCYFGVLVYHQLTLPIKIQIVKIIKSFHCIYYTHKSILASIHRVESHKHLDRIRYHDIQELDACK
ncbi:hypothetical protein L207DRAFT_129414 [Hyaloscypha variabilis F]|uniref:Uncharacterized protein n=1 Tax=Hyaloscypha variabilis (strain UAMH 11265 / GT02V1 / F) TaxID=1149755 RepID=A0A2J6R8V2_HYAVF|nr:hypothetical protein L207DRAFT_129414 [Hyaloscypha variabilis F]